MVGDTAFPARPWLLKGYPDRTTKNQKELYFNRKLRSSRVVSEHAYGMVKSAFEFSFFSKPSRSDLPASADLEDFSELVDYFKEEG